MKDTEKKLTRLPVKWVRDSIKSKYKEKEPCYICGSEENIELHHLYSVSELWNNWLKKNHITINTDEDVLANRNTFEQDNLDFLSNDNLFSLCKPHHLKLHSVYGKSYTNYIGGKVRNWIEKQKIKYGEQM